MELGLAGKTVVVTGGGSNIGRGIAIAFAKEKCNVVLAEIDQKQGEKVAEEIKALGGEVTLIPTDVTKLESVEATFKKAVEIYKKIDILVNNVGWDKLQPFTSTTPEFWEKVISINYRNVLNCTKSILPYMQEQKNGVIINIGSDAGRVGEYYEAVYSGTKGAIISFSKTVAKEMGRHGIRVNVVCPGTTVPASPDEIGELSLWKAEGGSPVMTPEQLEKAKKLYPLRRLGKPEDIANAVVFMASDAASFITGQTLSVSGGYSMM